MSPKGLGFVPAFMYPVGLTINVFPIFKVGALVTHKLRTTHEVINSFIIEVYLGPQPPHSSSYQPYAEATRATIFPKNVRVRDRHSISTLTGLVIGLEKHSDLNVVSMPHAR